jgi:outer membrane immunogenic protein
MSKVLPALAAVGAVGVLSIFAEAAVAADMINPVRVPAPEPIFSWTGFYGGLNLGISGAQHTTQLQSAQLGTVTTMSAGVAGIALGGQLGANWQMGGIVLGVEGDFQITSERRSNTTTVPGGSITEVFARPVFTTLRGRAGWAFADGWLAYATAGGAVIGSNENFTVNGGPNWSFPLTHGGWTAGAGLEGAINRNWSWKVEYLYMQTARFTTNVNLFGATVPWSAQLNDNVVRAGVNYRF